MAKKIKLISLVCLVICCSGCKTGTDGMFGILSGFLAWARQDWALSSSAFLETALDSTADGNSALREYAIYGLASTYIAQDEYDSALARLAELGDSASAEIRSGVWYQAGIIAYRRGEYEDASAFFRKSLESNPSSLDAKINLELSHQSLVERRADRSTGSSGVREDADKDGSSETIFNLIRKKEQDRWKNQEDQSSRSATADY